MSLATRLKLNVLLSAAMVLVVSLVFALALLMQSDARERARAADELMRGAFELDLFSNSYLRHPDERPIEQWMIRHSSLVKSLEEIPFKEPGQKFLVQRMRQNLDNMKVLFDDLVASYARGRSASLARRSQLASLLLTRSRAISLDAARLSAQSNEAIDAVNRNITLGLPIIAIVMVLVAMRLSARLGKSINEPITKLRTGTEIIGSGNLDHRIGITTSDEIGELSRSFDRMTEQLQAITVSKNALEQEIEERKRAEDKLRESEQRLRRFYESGLLGVISWDMSGRIIDANDKFLEMVGYTRKELISGKIDWVHMTPPEYRHLDEQSIAELKATGINREPFEKEYIRKDGTRIPIIVAGAMLDETRFNGVAFVLDITDRKRAEQALKESNRKISGILESISDGFFTLDNDMRVTYFNRAAERQLGRKGEEVLGRKLFEAFPEAKGSLFEEEYTLALREKKPRSFETYFGVQPYENWYEVKVYPLENGISVYFQVTTERKRAEERLRETHERLSIAKNAAKLGIHDYDMTSGTIRWDRRMREIWGVGPEEPITYEVFISGLHPDDRAPTQAAVDKALAPAGDGQYYAEFRVINRADGVTRWVAATGQAFFEKGRAVRLVGTVEDITERKKMEETITHQAHYDLLTGLSNRALFTDHLNFALTQAHRYQKQLAVMFLDLDRFKTINDTLGHSIGDELLREVGRRLKPCLREADTIARIGGDEFTVLLSQIAHVKDVSRIADKIMASVHHPFTINEHTFYVTTSIGISMYPEDGIDAETLIKNADIAMYHAKEQGKDRYQFYSPSLNIRTLERMILENSLRRTLERGELELFYQPQFDITTGQVVCTEALIRWRHPELGLLNPMQFIPMAEEIGFIVPIDEWVLRTACAQNKAWQDAGYPPVCVTVNLSSRQFKQPNLVDMVAQILKETGLDPKWLELEVTETIAMEDIEHTIPNVKKLAELGVNFSIDDFGTGYSSLSHLKRLPIQKLKIDKSFIRDITTDPDDRTIVNAIISMAHSMNLKVVAEGVETVEQLSILHSSWCDEVQGYLGTHPLPAGEYEHFLKSYGHLQVR